MVTGAKPAISSYRLDAAKVAAAKAEAAEATQAGGAGGAGFVSTNDCLVSGFGKLCGAHVMLTYRTLP